MNHKIIRYTYYVTSIAFAFFLYPINLDLELLSPTLAIILLFIDIFLFYYVSRKYDAKPR